MFRAVPRRIDLVGLGFALASLSCACQPELVVGAKKGEESSTCSRPDLGAAGAGPESTIDIGWLTGFENGFCDYYRAGGNCYNAPDASYQVAPEPRHGGQSAAAFFVTSAAGAEGTQTRCFLEGTLPPEAVYGAWFYVPALAENTGNWNLFHFRNSTAPPVEAGLWDVSLGSADDGSLFLYVFDFLNGGGVQFPPLETRRPVPIGSWFQVEFRLRRAADATGEVELYQNGVFVMGFQNVITDSSDTAIWYVGNLADALTPAESTIYVDDVTVAAMLAPR